MQRIRWRCRRGKLELDLFLIPFFDDCYTSLSENERQDFQRLLEEQDPDLHAFFMKEKECDDARLRTLIEKIREHRKLLNRH
jgi:antitoxin CptB